MLGVDSCVCLIFTTRVSLNTRLKGVKLILFEQSRGIGIRDCSKRIGFPDILRNTLETEQTLPIWNFFKSRTDTLPMEFQTGHVDSPRGGHGRSTGSRIGNLLRKGKSRCWPTSFLILAACPLYSPSYTCGLSCLLMSIRGPSVKIPRHVC